MLDIAPPLFKTFPSSHRDREDLGWVSSARSFPGRLLNADDARGFPLFAIAEDVVLPGRGFGLHAHRDMEIISYVVGGELEHVDSSGSFGVMRHGEIQAMTAGVGIRHSEMNASKDVPVHFLQIWILPAKASLTPSYSHAEFDIAAPLTLLAGAASGLVHLNQAMEIWRVAPDHDAVAFVLPDGARAWGHVVRGAITAGGQELGAGDGLAIVGCSVFEIHAESEDAEMLIFVDRSIPGGRC